MNTRHSLVIALCLSLSAVGVQAQTTSYEQAVQLKQASKLPDAELAFIEVLKQEPNNVLAFEQLAVVQSWQDKFDEAIINFKHALSIDHNYTPARIGLARVSYWQGKRDIALTEMSRVLKEQPAVPDNWILKGDILMADGKPKQAREAYVKAQILLDGKSNAALEIKIAHAKPPKRWRLDTGYVSDEYSAVRTDGHNSYAQVGYTFENKTTLYTRSEQYDSFDSSDRGIVVGAYYLPHKHILLNGEYYSNRDGADFRPDDMLSINAEFLFNENWQPLLSYRQSSYGGFDGSGKGDVTTVMPGLRWNYKIASVEVRHARTNNVDDSDTSVNSFKLNLNYANISPYIVYAVGEEGIPRLENSDISLVAEISILGVGAVYKVNDNVSLRLDYSREDRKDAYIHEALGVGMSVFF